MPALIPFIPLIAAGVTGGTELGLTLSNQPDTGALKKQQEEQAAADAAKAAKADADSKAQLLRAASPNAQAQVGGSLTEAPFASLTSDIAGTPGDIQTALRLLDPNSSGTQGLAFSGGT